MSITLSETAADRVRRFLDARGHGTGLRLAVKKTGCSGFAYVVDLEDEIGEEDRVFESNGIPVIVDPDTLPMVAGTHIDFKRDGLNVHLRQSQREESVRLRRKLRRLKARNAAAGDAATAAHDPGGVRERAP